MAEGKTGMPKWQRAPDELVREFGEMVRPMPGVEVRKMFGYPCAWLNGQMFAGLFGDGMFLRLSEADRKTFLAVDGARQFEPIPGRPMREYVMVPPAMLGQPTQINDWLERALKHAATLPPKETKKKKGAKA